MSLDTEKQLAGNYVRLVNQVRSLHGDLQRMTEAFDNSTQLNNKLHDEIILQNSIIKLMGATIYDNHFMKSLTTIDHITEEYRNLVIDTQLVAEQNKKVANCESI